MKIVWDRQHLQDQHMDMVKYGSNLASSGLLHWDSKQKALGVNTL